MPQAFVGENQTASIPCISHQQVSRPQKYGASIMTADRDSINSNKTARQLKATVLHDSVKIHGPMRLDKLGSMLQ